MHVRFERRRICKRRSSLTWVTAGFILSKGKTKSKWVASTPAERDAWVNDIKSAAQQFCESIVGGEKEGGNTLKVKMIRGGGSSPGLGRKR